MMESEATQRLEQLAERARNDPAFFHALVYDPQRAIAEMADLDRQTQASILAVDPDTLVMQLAGLQICGITCGDTSCGSTCGMRSCDVTCASSCTGRTCKSSCGNTTHVVARA
jgi:YD repeat-containing protein